MSKVQRSDFKEQYLVKKRDIIFRSRGVTNTAVLLREQLAPAIVAAPLMRIRVNHEGVLPDYLYWFINQKSAQAFFQSRVRGTAQKMIPKQSLEKLVVDVPPMTIQQSIIALAELERREQELIRRIAQKRRRYLEETLTRLAKEPHNEPKD